MAERDSTIHHVDLTGQVFGRLTVLGLAPQRCGNRRRWFCRCICGTVIDPIEYTLVHGNSTSCGCGRRDSVVTHGRARTPEHRTWIRIHSRCTNPKATGYRNYGGRGIKVCERWNSFEAFFVDMGPRPGPQHTIERKDNEKDYCPDNCCWATRKQQARNRRTNRLLTYHGETLPVIAWAERLGMTKETIAARLRYGWSIERVIETPVSKSSPVGN